MAEQYQIRFNVRGSAKETESQTKSIPGHINITLAKSDDDIGTSIGATTLDDASFDGQIYKWFGADDDGIIRDESEDLLSDSYTWVTRSVPVTENQFRTIAERVKGVVDKKYNYFARPGFGEPPQACSTFAKAIFRMTGHSGELGDLFSMQDRDGVGGLVWHEITGRVRPEAIARKFRPTEPNSGHVPDVADIGIKLHDEYLKLGDGDNGQDRGFLDDINVPPLGDMILPLMFPGRTILGRSSAPQAKASSGPARLQQNQRDKYMFEGNTILTRRKRWRNSEQDNVFASRKATTTEPRNAASPTSRNVSLLFPNSDHN